MTSEPLVPTSTTQEWAYREKLAAESIAYVAWRHRNPAAGTFDPIGDRGHCEMVEAARLYLADPRPRAFSTQQNRGDDGA